MLALAAAILGDQRDNKPLVSDATLHIDPQQKVQRGDLFIDGYIAQMFGPLDAEAYYVSLLNREPTQIQCHVDVTGAFLDATPLELASDRYDWVIDYAARDTGPVIQQKIWTPRRPSDRVRRVDHEHLPPPIFFIHNNGRDLGLPLVEAAGGNCMSLRGAEEEAPVGPSAHAQIRINVSSISAFIVRI
jgi:hypothetical protein